MKYAACLLALAAFAALPAHAQSNGTQPPKFAPVPPPPGMHDPGVQAVAAPAKPAAASSSGSTPATVSATPLPGKPIPLPATPGDKGKPEDAKGEPPPEVVVHTEGDAVYQEYRRGGRVYMVVVTQKNGLSYTYMVGNDGTMRATNGAPPVRPVMYKILEWGKSRPAESKDGSQGDGH